MLYQLSYSRLLLVGVIGFEPTTSASQTPRASTCATPRCNHIIIYLATNVKRVLIFMQNCGII